MAPQVAVAGAGSRVSLSPAQGLMVAFRSAAETLRDQALLSVVLGVLMAWLLIRGIGDRGAGDLEDSA